MSDHPLIEALKKLETGLGDEAARHIAALEKRVKQLGRTNAAKQIESLQRENEELKAKLSDWEISPRGSQEIISIQADRIAELETRAITPEMKGRIIKMAEIDDAEWDNFLVENGYPPSVKPAVTQLISDLRDLLGEQG